MATWNLEAALKHLREKAADRSMKNCAAYTRQAIEAGGITLGRPSSGYAKDYGPKLRLGGFREQNIPPLNYEAGDVVVIQPYAGGGPAGHMAMYDGKRWISDFIQRDDIYPGPGYRDHKPPFVVYRYAPALAS